MTEHKWTPGPWFVSQRADDLAIYITQKVCGVGRVAKIWMGRSAQNHNAHLIAAAPDLYEVLEWVESTGMVEHGGGGDMIRAALAKARGEA